MSWVLGVGTFWNFICFVQCALNLAYAELVGGKAGCQYQAIQGVTFVTGLGMLLAVWSWSVSRTVVTGRLSNVRISAYMALGMLYMFAVSLVIILGNPSGDPGETIQFSGSFCFADLYTTWGVLMFYIFALCVPMVIMAASAISIVQEIRRCRVLLAASNIADIAPDEIEGVKVKAASQKDAQMLGLFALVFFGCFLPFTVSTLYQWTTDKWSPGVLDVFAGVFAHGSTVALPLVFLVYGRNSKSMRAYVKNMLTCKSIASVGPNPSTLAKEPGHRGHVEQDSFFTLSAPERDAFAKDLLTNKKSFRRLVRAAKYSYSQESLLCFVDVTKIKKDVMRLLEMCGDGEGLMFESHVQECYQSMERIMHTYFNKHFSPLEVHISDCLMQETRELLCLPAVVTVDVSINMALDVAGLMNVDTCLGLIEREVLALVIENTLSPYLKNHPYGLNSSQLMSHELSITTTDTSPMFHIRTVEVKTFVPRTVQEEERCDISPNRGSGSKAKTTMTGSSLRSLSLVTAPSHMTSTTGHRGRLLEPILTNIPHSLPPGSTGSHAQHI